MEDEHIDQTILLSSSLLELKLDWKDSRKSLLFSIEITFCSCLRNKRSHLLILPILSDHLSRSRKYPPLASLQHCLLGKGRNTRLKIVVFPKFMLSRI